ncbi:MAG: hypothetical protein AAFU50_00705 [Pseudomonadota bacterium]
MTATVIRLHHARTARQHAALDRGGDTNETAPPVDALDLCELSLIVRNRFQIPEGLSDDAILRSLREIRAAKDDRGRWLAAFDSTLGLFLSLRMSDFNTELKSLLALVPPAPH